MFYYESIACIEFRGKINARGESNGHYIYDLKSAADGKWYRTNDNKEPQEISVKDVTKLAYVVLFKMKD